MSSPPAPAPSPSRPRRTHPPDHTRAAYLDWAPPLPSSSLPGAPDVPLPAAGPAPGGLSKPFHLADVARAALARPRPLAPWTPEPSTSRAEWADRDGSTSDSDTSFSSACSSPPSSAPSSPFPSPPSSCTLTPSSSSEGFTLGASSTATAPPTPTTPSSPARPRAAALTRPSTSTSSTDWFPADFSLKLLFMHVDSPAPSASADDADDIPAETLPPAFFPAQRISFSPRLRISAVDGIPYSSLGGMHLGVTGMCETLDSQGKVKSKRMIADFCTDLSSGLAFWKRDGQAASSGELSGEQEKEPRLRRGTYVLPLTMKLPDSQRLPPSFECAQFRISYVMSLALFSSALTSDGTPRRLKVFSVPFHILPSTLPTPAPELPILTHDHKKGVFASLLKSLSFAAPRVESGYFIVYPSLPTSHYSPASQASIPVTLRIVDRPLEPTDLYIRLALVRKTYFRESPHANLATAIEDEWGQGLGVTPRALRYSEEVILEPWCRDEEEIISRWGWVPYSGRPGADPMEEAEVVIQDISLPLSGVRGEGWTHGYSTSVDLEPAVVPSQAHGDCSWFSPAFRTRPPVVKEYAKHVHVSSRFFLSVQVGFATPALRETLLAIGAASPDMEIPAPNGFTQPCAPSTSRFSGASLANPFAAQTPRIARPSTPSSPTTSPFNTPAFPGKLRELWIPFTLGSVAEPSMSCFANVETAQMRADREEREERGEDVRGEGEGAEGAWMCAPPTYIAALKAAPAYL